MLFMWAHAAYNVLDMAVKGEDSAYSSHSFSRDCCKIGLGTFGRSYHEQPASALDSRLPLVNYLIARLLRPKTWRS